MAARPTVSVQVVGEAKGAKASLTMPNVMLSPIRPDIVQFVHTSMAKNHRQPYAVAENAGHQHSAESWGTGRAVARVPRVSGGGNGRSGQAAFGNQCRKGRMYAPTKIWRKWHRKINLNQKRFAVASALAASALPSLVQARGHRIEQVPELPLVLDDAVQSIQKTKAAVAALKSVGAYADVEKAGDSRKIRRGKGKTRNRRHVMRRGPLVVYNEDHGIQQAFRNLPGVELCQVDQLNLLQLAPGGHLGRFIVWTRGAFSKLNSLWGSQNHEGQKAGYTLPRPIIHNADITRIINSDEIQSKVRPSIKTVHRFTQHKNPLTNFGVRVRLNPYALSLRRSQLLAEQRRKSGKKTVMETKRQQALAAADRTHEPQQRLNYQRIVNDDFKAPEKALKTKLSKPRAPQVPPKPLTAEQRKAKVEARKKKPKKVVEKKAKVDEAKEKAEAKKLKEAPKQIPKQLLSVATAKVTKIKKASAGGKKAGGKGEKGKKEEGKAEAGKAEAGKKEAGKKEAGKKGK